MILMYHKVAPESPTMWWVTADDFRRQMLELRGRKIVYLDDYDPKDPRHVVITFDGIYQNVLKFAAPTLKEMGYPFELFVTGDYVGLDNGFDAPEPNALFATTLELGKLMKMGGRLQWHGNVHLNLGDTTDPDVISRELDVPESLRRLDPQGYRWFAYPHGTFNDAVHAQTQQYFAGALSCHQGDGIGRWQLNRVTVTNDMSFRQASVSVIIACHNYGAYLAEAVESAMRQTLPPQEILISDDASTDDTPQVMDMLARKYGNRLRTHINPDNMGIVKHFNQAIHMVSGDYVCFLGADNRFRSDYLEHTVGELDKDDSAAVAYTDFALFGLRAGIAYRHYREIWPTRDRHGEFYEVQFPDFDENSRNLLLSKQNFIHGSSLFRRTAFETVGGYRDGRGPEDWNLFRTMVKAGWNAVHCPLPLLEYRQHSRLQANTRFESESALHYYREGYRKAKDQLEQANAQLRNIKASLAWKISAPLRVGERLLRKASPPRGSRNAPSRPTDPKATATARPRQGSQHRHASYGGQRPEVVAAIPAGCMRILDIGCSNGAVGAQLKARTPICAVYGIEGNPQLALAASQHLDRVIQGDLDRFDWQPLLQEPKFDCLIFSDILEHLTTPGKVLQESLQLLAPEGYVIVSIPNIRHISALYSVFLKGTFPQRDRGIFDDTHLRWFTLADIRTLLGKRGLHVEWISANYRVFDAPGGRFNNLAARSLPYLGALPFVREFFAYQFILRARR